MTHDLRAWSWAEPKEMPQGQTSGIRNSEREATERNGESQPQGRNKHGETEVSAESGSTELWNYRAEQQATMVCGNTWSPTLASLQQKEM